MMNFETEFESVHSDRLTVLQCNENGTKLLTASVDHRLVVYNIEKVTGRREQLDVFTAHDAEIRDAKWFHPSIGSLFVTIANDLQMRIWVEDSHQAPMSGRRFRRSAAIKSEQLVPFVSVDVKTIGDDTYIAVIDRQGLLSLYEPTNPDEYHAWSLVDQFHVHSPIPGRGDHTSFRVRFDPSPVPLPYLSFLSDDEKQLSLAVTAMNEVKLYRSTSDADTISSYASLHQQAANVGRGATHRLFLFEVLRFQHLQSSPPTSAGSLLRDIAYSPANIKGTDIIAVSSIDGTVGIYEISLEQKPLSNLNKQAAPTSKQSFTRPLVASHQSNLTSALQSPALGTTSNQQGPSRTQHPFPYVHNASSISILENAHSDAWSVQWESNGDVLLSSGTDGTVKMWKRSTNDVTLGEFELYLEQGGEEDSSDKTSSVDGNDNDK